MAWQRETTSRSGIIAATLLIGLTACQPPDQKAPEPAAAAPAEAIAGDVAQASYGIGYTVATNLDEQFGGAIDQEAFLAGLGDRFADRERRVSETDAQHSMATMIQKQQEIQQARSNATLDEGVKFLAENGKREGVTTTESGLQYEVLVAGDGPKPSATDTVTTHYQGTLINGKVFDSSVERGTPASFPLNRVIPGWTEALQLMPVGSKWRLYIPPDLAYGNRAAGAIPPNSTLIFDVELLGIGDDAG